jgi:hypothetical protein
MIISLIGVGFAAWSINTPTDETNHTGGFVTDDVVMVEALSSPVFENELIYNSKGFFTQYEFDYSTGKEKLETVTYDNITYSVNVDLPMCTTKLVEADDFQVRIRLKDETGYTNINQSLKLVTVTVSINNLTGYSVDNYVDETNEEVVVNVTIPKEKVGEAISKVSIKYDFSKVSVNNEAFTPSEKLIVEEFFKQLATVKEEDRAFIVAASLYAIYDDVE